MTQQNAALVEQAAAAATSMQTQAHALAEAVSVFKVGASSQAVLSSPRVQQQMTNTKSISATARTIPAPSRPAQPPAMRTAALPAAKGDDWEEF